MKKLGTLAFTLALVTEAAAAQSLGELARKERERKAQQDKSSVSITTDEVRRGQFDLSPPLDPARQGDLEYLLQQLARPRTSPELLAAFIPHHDQAIPRLLPLLSSVEPLKRVAPATVLTVLGNSQGLAAMANLLAEATERAAEPAVLEAAGAPRLEAAREADYALRVTRLGVWRFTEGSSLTPEQVAQRMEQGPPIEIVGGVDNGQRLFNRALREKDENLRRGANTLLRVAAGKDFGYQPDQSAEANEAAIQEMTTFLATERTKVISHLGSKKK
jgi:hypothetical protein